MASIAENLQAILSAKTAIYEAIVEMGGTIDSGTPFSEYSTSILSIGGGSSIPEGLHKFTISESQWPDCAMMVEAFYNPDELSKGETGSQVVNIYSDPSGEPINTITYDGYVVGGASYVDANNTNNNAGVYCTNTSDWSPFESDHQAFKLECRTAGTYYIEVVDHTDPRFYDANGTQIYPE